jgi:hypothetical protein
MLKLTCIIFKDREFLPHSKRTVSITRTNQLMLYTEIIGCCENPTKPKHTVWAERRDSVAEPGGTRCNERTLSVKVSFNMTVQSTSVSPGVLPHQGFRPQLYMPL